MLTLAEFEKSLKKTGLIARLRKELSDEIRTLRKIDPELARAVYRQYLAEQAEVMAGRKWL